MDLFSNLPLQNLPGTPLAERQRPIRFDKFQGQATVLNQVRGYLKAGRLPNLIFWGPPGTGKTTLALLIAREFSAEFVSLHAVEAGAKVIRETGDVARNRRRLEGRLTLVFIDEIHRLNKAQQDVLLPFVEQGDLILIGATTENPSYEINRALMSRCRLLVFQRLSTEELDLILNSACDENQLSIQKLSPEARTALLDWADGDARRLLAAVESITLQLGLENSSGELNWEQIVPHLGARSLAYDKNSDQHYDLISAFIKSVRGSDPDASLYWFARMVEGGEDPLFIARRLVILASEDVGNADPRALTMAVSAAQAVELIGWPEAQIALSQVITYLSCAPKSNASYVALNHAKEFVEKTGSLEVPVHLRSSRTPEMRSLGYGREYKYPHSESRAWVAQDYSPLGVKLPNFFRPTAHGFEKTMVDHQNWKKQKSET